MRSTINAVFMILFLIAFALAGCSGGGGDIITPGSQVDIITHHSIRCKILSTHKSNFCKAFIRNGCNISIIGRDKIGKGMDTNMYSIFFGNFYTIL